jgi:hypothetical protein
MISTGCERVAHLLYHFVCGEEIQRPCSGKSNSPLDRCLELTTLTWDIQLITGDSDQIICAGNCTSILEPAAVDFPASKRFETYLQPNTGHGLNQHHNASGFYDVVLDFLKA